MHKARLNEYNVYVTHDEYSFEEYSLKLYADIFLRIYLRYVDI